MNMHPPPLAFLCNLVIHVAEPLAIGETGQGLRRIVNITGGEVRGPRVSGRILPGGADFQVLRADGMTDLHARYAFETVQGERVYIENSGIRFGPRELMEKIKRGAPVDPALIYFRTAPRFETGAARLRFLMERLFVGVGARHPDRVELDVFEVG